MWFSFAILNAWAVDTGTLSIQSTSKMPAQIYWQGELVCEHLPCKVRVSKEVGSLQINVPHCSNSIQTVEIQDYTEIPLDLDCSIGFLNIPESGAELVLLDGGILNTEKLVAVPVGQHAITFEHACYERDTQWISVSPLEEKVLRPNWESDKTQVVEIQLQSAAGRKVSGEVYVNGNFVGTTGSALNIPQCVKTLLIKSKLGDYQVSGAELDFSDGYLLIVQDGSQDLSHSNPSEQSPSSAAIALRDPLEESLLASTQSTISMGMGAMIAGMYALNFYNQHQQALQYAQSIRDPRFSDAYHAQMDAADSYEQSLNTAMMASSILWSSALVHGTFWTAPKVIRNRYQAWTQDGIKYHPVRSQPQYSNLVVVKFGVSDALAVEYARSVNEIWSIHTSIGSLGSGIGLGTEIFEIAQNRLLVQPVVFWDYRDAVALGVEYAWYNQNSTGNFLWKIQYTDLWGHSDLFQIGTGMQF